MKKKLFLLATAVIAGTKLFAQDTLTGGLQVDSINVEQKMTVNGQTLMRQDATASRDLTVEGDLYARNRIYYPNAPEYQGELGEKDIIVFNPLTGLLEKSSLSAIKGELSKWECTPVNGVATVGWSVLPNKIVYDCPTVFTGVGTANPLVRLHVAGDERVDGFARISDRLAVGDDPSSFSRALIKTGSYGAGLEINGAGNSGSYPKLILLQFSNDQTELIKATNSTTNTNPFIVNGNGSMILNNGMTTTFNLASDGQLIMRHGGTGEKTFQFDINGMFRARRVRVDAETWADYVFEPSYQLMPLAEVKNYVQQNKHLPSVPPEAEVKEQGIDLAEMNKILIQKIEELTLYLIEQNENTADLQAQVKALQEKIATLEAATK